jgi:hypothetical protein
MEAEFARSFFHVLELSILFAGDPSAKKIWRGYSVNLDRDGLVLGWLGEWVVTGPYQKFANALNSTRSSENNIFGAHLQSNVTHTPHPQKYQCTCPKQKKTLEKNYHITNM